METEYPIYFGTISFEARSEGNVAKCKFPSCVLPPSCVGVKSVEVACPTSELLKCKIEIAPTNNRKRLDELAITEANWIVDRFAFVLAMDFRDPVIVERCIFVQRGRDSLPSQLINPASTKASCGNFDVILNFNNSDDLVQKIGNVDESHAECIEDFRLVLNRPSGTDRFMGFYQLLLKLLADQNGNESQDRLDAFVLKHYPKTKTSPKPPKSSQKKVPKVTTETEFTRLRNEFAHVRDGADRRKRNSEMEALSGDLMDLAKRAIQEAQVASSISKLPSPKPTPE